MSKRLKIPIFIVFIFFAGFLVFNGADAQDCKLTGASWGKQTVSVGEKVNMNVTGQDCNGWEVSLKIYEDDILVGPLGSPDDYLGTDKVTFTNNSNVTFEKVFTKADYDKGHETGEGTNEEVYFEAVVGSGATESKKTSNNLTLKPSSGGGGGGGDGDGGGEPGEGEVSFEIQNPIKAESLVDLAKAIGKFLFQIAIPIAVIIIIYAGLLFLTSGGNKEKITKAGTALLYAVVGLAIILIGQGFFTLIKSILNLGTP